MTQEPFAVLFDLEGQLDCTLHATEASAQIEFDRLSEKYAAERANYSASVQMMRVRVPDFSPPDVPGSWHRGRAGNYWPDAICDGSQILAVVKGTGYPIGVGWSPESERVAQMMVAAPVMLAALQKVDEWLNGFSTRQEMQRQISAAISAATVPIWGPFGCVHEWRPDDTSAGGSVGLVCDRCGAQDEKDVS